MKNFFKKLKDNFNELLFPSKIHCFICGSEIFDDNYFCLCQNCFKNLNFLSNSNTCKICGTKLTGIGNLCERCVSNQYKSFKLARAVFEYKGEIVNAIHNLKFNNKRYIAKPLSNILFDYFSHSTEFEDTDIIIPVPLHKTRLKQRGYNQTELMLENFKENYNVCCDAVIRTKQTESQRTKDAKERFENMKNCFEVVKPEIIKHKNILIVDDVFTTGATCSSLSKTLLQSGARQVKCLTLCNTTKQVL